MLVLARQLNERIVLPTVPATIEVVAIRPNGVRLGIDAPSAVTILREEVLHRGATLAKNLSASSPEDEAKVRLQRVERVVNNRLQTVAMALDLVDAQLDADNPELRAMLQSVQSEVRRLDAQLRELLDGFTEDTFASPCLVVAAENAFSI